MSEQQADFFGDMTEEFERRLQDENAQQEIIDKEKKYQLFKLTRQYGLDMNTFDAWQKDPKCAHGLDLIFIQSKPYIYRALSLSEHIAIAEKCGNDMNKYKWEVVRTGLLWPVIQPGSEPMQSAGLSSTLSDAILRKSGFGADMEPIAL